MIEIGAGNGEENCTRSLVEVGWSGAWIEADSTRAARAEEVAGGRVTVLAEAAQPRTIGRLLRTTSVGDRPDLVVVDIDGNDWWVLLALLRSVQPRVLVVEYNATFPPGRWWIRRFDADAHWKNTFRHGASLEALSSLARRHGLHLIGCDSAGVNAFFVDDGISGDPLVREVPVSQAYVAPWFGSTPWGHPRRPSTQRPMKPLPAVDLDKLALTTPLRLVRRRCSPGQPVGMSVQIDNGTSTRLTSGGDFPIHLAVRWRRSSEQDEPWDRSTRFSLIRSIPERGRNRMTLWNRAPTEPGTYLLECTLVQEGVAWLVDITPRNARASVVFSVR